MEWGEVFRLSVLAVVGVMQAFLLQLVARMNAKIRQVEHQTNSMKDELVTTTRRLGEVQGHAAGVADEKSRAEGGPASGVKLG